LVAFLVCIPASFAGQRVTREENTNLFGADYRAFDMDAANPDLCRKACGEDPDCRAYTYVKPGVQGPKARCYLKNSVPKKSVNRCCVSGVKSAGSDKPPSLPRLGNGSFPGQPSTEIAVSGLPGAFPAGASLYYNLGDSPSNAYRRVWPGAPDPVFLWEASRMRGRAGAALWQVSTSPFAPFAGDGPAVRHPEGLVASGVVKRKDHFTVIIADVLEKARSLRKQPTLVFGDGSICDHPDCDGFQFVACGGADGGGRLVDLPRIRGYRLDWCKHAGRDCGEPAATLFCREKGYERAVLWAKDPRIGGGGVRQDQFTFYVRVIPLESPGNPAIVGQPSNVIPILFNHPEAPPNFRFYTEGTARTPGPAVELTALRYRAWHYIHEWPDGCKEASGKVRRPPPIVKAFAKVWDGLDKIYDKGKDLVVDAVDEITFGAIPKKIWAFGLDVAMMYSGVPPDLPNLKDMVSGGLDPKAIASGALEHATSYGLGQVAAGGLDFMAAKMADSVLEAIPPDSIVPGTGNVLADIVLSELEGRARGELEEDVRRVIEDPARSIDDKIRYALEARARRAILESSGELARILKKEYKYCAGLTLQPTYFVTVRNTSGYDIPDFTVQVSDTGGIFESKSASVMLRAGQTMTVPLAPEKKIRDLPDRWQRVSANEAEETDHWWGEIYSKRPTKIVVRITGDRVCRDPLGPLGQVCETDRKAVFVSPEPVLLKTDHNLVR